MFVAVRKMRIEGKKVPLQDLATFKVDSTQGHLWVISSRLPTGERVTVAKLTENAGPPGRHLLPQLDRATVTAMKGKQFVVSGIEVLRVGVQAFSYRQSWLCYALSETMTPPPPSGQR